MTSNRESATQRVYLGVVLAFITTAWSPLFCLSNAERSELNHQSEAHLSSQLHRLAPAPRSKRTTSQRDVLSIAKKTLRPDLLRIGYSIGKLEECCEDAKTNVTRIEEELANICPEYFLQYRAFWKQTDPGPVVQIVQNVGFTLSNQNQVAQLPANPALRGLLIIDAVDLIPGNVVLGPLLVDTAASLASHLSQLRSSPLSTSRSPLGQETSSSQSGAIVGKFSKLESNAVMGRFKTQVTQVLAAAKTVRPAARAKREAAAGGPFGDVGFQFIATLASLRLNTATESLFLTPTDPIVLNFLLTFGNIVNVRIWMYACEKDTTMEFPGGSD